MPKEILPKNTDPNLTVDQVKAKLTEFGVEFPEDAAEADLVELLQNAITDLNKKSREAAAAPSNVPNRTVGEVVSIERGQWEAMVQRVQDLEQATGIDKEDPKLAAKKLAAQRARKQVKVRFVEDKMVVGYGRNWNEYDRDGRQRTHIMALLEDGSESDQDAIDFFGYGKYAQAEVVRIEDLEPQIIDQGFVFKTKLDYKQYRSEKTDEEVKVEVTIPKYLYHVLVPGREKEIVLSPEALN